MFEEGTIIYFDPFYFKNGNTAKPKYFIVLKAYNNNSNIIASLPTRSRTIPAYLNIDFGCLNDSEINLDCFIIKSNTEITECHKSFPFTTYIYGHQIDDYSIDILKENYQNEGIDYIIFGKMKIVLFDKLIACLKNSNSIKNKYKRIL